MTEATDIVILDEERPTKRAAKRATGVPAVVDNSPMSRMMAALDRGVSPEQISQMMELQEKWERREAEKAYNEAMAAFSAEAIEIIKRKEVDFQTAKGRTHYWHAELSDVVEAVKPALAKHGFSYRWDTKQERDWLDVTCILKHRLGHFESCTMGGPPDESGGKNRIQGFKSTKSYLERQTLEAICGVAEKGEDDDGRGAGGKKESEIPADLLQAARDEALKGMKAFAAWIKALTEEQRELLEPESEALKKAARNADAAGVQQ